MKQTFEQYSLELSGIAERLAQEAEMRARWLLLGVALGATLAAGYVQALGGGR